jgi:hypothetical protein
MFVRASRFFCNLRLLVFVLPVIVCGPVLSHAGSDRPVDSDRMDEAAVPNSLHTVIDDMSEPHEAEPEGVPRSYKWSRGPTVHHLDQVPPAVLDRFHAIVAWGQAYAAAQGNPARNVRVEVRDIKAYELAKNDLRWHLAQAYRRVIGAAYREDFGMNFSKRIHLRREPDGGISVKLVPGYNFHFFAPQRAPFDPTNTLGIYTTYQARLIVDDPSLRDDRDKARILANAGCDVYEGLNSRMRGHAEPNVGIGRFKFLTSEWQSFNMISLTKSQIEKYPPPVR